LFYFYLFTLVFCLVSGLQVSRSLFKMTNRPTDRSHSGRELRPTDHLFALSPLQPHRLAITPSPSLLTNSKSSIFTIYYSFPILQNSVFLVRYSLFSFFLSSPSGLYFKFVHSSQPLKWPSIIFQSLRDYLLFSPLIFYLFLFIFYPLFLVLSFPRDIPILYSAKNLNLK